MNAYVYRAVLIVTPWAACVAMDYWFHRLGIHRGPWRWKWSVATFGIGSLFALWFIHRFLDPRFFDLP